MEINIDELTKGPDEEIETYFSVTKPIASGSFGTVFQAIEKSTNREVAVKVVNKEGAKSFFISQMKEEVQILKQLQHENIVQFFGYVETSSKLYIMMELIPCGTLSTWLKNHIGKITEEDTSTIIRSILSAVDYLHSKQICHRDIKPENIMLADYNDLSSLKLIDFGLSSQNFNYFENSDYCGTLLYMAPEQIEKKSYTKTVDIWSIGVIMFMLLNNGKHPFYVKGDKKRGYVEKIKSKKLTLFKKCSPLAKSLLFKLLEPNPDWRYTANKGLQHPWITRNKDDKVPETFNEILIKRANLKNANDLVMISLFLNHFAKKKKKEEVFRINQKYTKKVKMYNQKQKNQLLLLKERQFEVSDSSDEEDEKENEKNSLNIIKENGSMKVKKTGKGKIVKLGSLKTIVTDKRFIKKKSHTKPAADRNKGMLNKGEVAASRAVIRNQNGHHSINEFPQKKSEKYLLNNPKKTFKPKSYRNKSNVNEHLNTIAGTESDKKSSLTISTNNIKSTPHRFKESCYLPKLNRSVCKREREKNKKKLLSDIDGENFSIIPLILPKISSNFSKYRFVKLEPCVM